MPASTEKLVRRAQAGDKEAFIALMDGHKLPMTRAAIAILHNEEDAADAIAETVMEAFSRLCTLRQPKYFKTWLTRALICNCCDILRQKQHYVPMDQLPEAEAPAGHPSDPALDIQACLAQLAENDRLVLTLHYMDGLKVKEIAGMLQTKESTIKARLMRSRQRLQKIYLEREGNSCGAK